MQTITPTDLATLQAAGKARDLIDVRTPGEFNALHADGARNVPLDALDPAAVTGSRTDSPDQPIYFICAAGTRGGKACEKMIASGVSNVVNVTGGTNAWAAANLPVVRGKQVISLERQVRIVAGSLVLLGVTLGFLVHPGFFGLSAFVGAGLIFAGVTDFCGMAMLLGRCPWNR
jgi:rhodanese-related sulfurtransferase